MDDWKELNMLRLQEETAIIERLDQGLPLECTADEYPTVKHHLIRVLQWSIDRGSQKRTERGEKELARLDALFGGPKASEPE